MTEKLLHIAEDNTHKHLVSISKSTRSSLTERVEDAVGRQHEAQGTDREAAAAQECSAILLDEHYDFVRKMRLDLVEAKPAFKKWWSKIRHLMNSKQRVSNIPALKDGTAWILDAEGKANCVVSCFETKNLMIEEVANEYSEIHDVHLVVYCG